jgi:hypothetical protein
MNQLRFAGLALRLRLALLRAGPVMLGVLAVLLVSAAALAWLVHALFQQQAEGDALRARAVAASQAANTQNGGAMAAPPAPTPAPRLDNLDAFYAALGQRRNAEKQVRTLFELAAKSGLVLSQGEYKSAWDRNARVHTYQVNLPVKGSYTAIWQFALGALRALPFAALDDVSFRRDSIGDPVVEARLRLTFYLADGAGGAQ